MVIGAGAIGGAVGGRLHQHGHSMVLVARGPHFEALSRDGLRLRRSGRRGDARRAGRRRSRRSRLERATTSRCWPRRRIRRRRLSNNSTAVAPTDVPVLCLQNGVANERMALRLFPNVHGVVVMLPAAHLDPGAVVVGSERRSPASSTSAARPMASTTSTTASPPTSAARRSRRSRPPTSWRGSGPSSCSTSATRSRRPAPTRTARPPKVLADRARAEGEACFTAAGWTWTDDASFAARRKGILAPWRPADGNDASWRLDVPEPAAPYGQHGGRLPERRDRVARAPARRRRRRPTSFCRRRSGGWHRTASAPGTSPCAGSPRHARRSPLR